MSEAMLRTDLALVGIDHVVDEADPGHVRLYRDGKLVGDYVIRNDNLEHFEILHHVRDWWKNSETQQKYLDRVHALIRRIR